MRLRGQLPRENQLQVNKAYDLMVMDYIEKYKDVKIEFLSCNAGNISSSAIRKDVNGNVDISDRVPAAVDEYIRDKGLYLQGADI